jgi:hypothetical protein
VSVAPPTSSEINKGISNRSQPTLTGISNLIGNATEFLLGSYRVLFDVLFFSHSLVLCSPKHMAMLSRRIKLSIDVLTHFLK